MMPKRPIPPGQTRGILKEHIGGILSLGGTPVIRLMERASDLLVQRMSLLEQSIQCLCPVGVKLLGQKSLDLDRLFHPRKTVVPLHIVQSGSVHLPSQPLSAIQTDIHRERKPGLDSHRHQSKVPVLVIMIEMQAFARLQNQVDLFGFPIAPNRIRQARLHGRNDRNQSLGLGSKFGGAPALRASQGLLTEHAEPPMFMRLGRTFPQHERTAPWRRHAPPAPGVFSSTPSGSVFQPVVAGRVRRSPIGRGDQAAPGRCGNGQDGNPCGVSERRFPTDLVGNAILGVELEAEAGAVPRGI